MSDVAWRILISVVVSYRRRGHGILGICDTVLAVETGRGMIPHGDV